MMYIPSENDKKLYSKMSICILSPIMHAEPQWVKSMVNMVAYSWMHGLKIYAFGCSERTVVDWARNELAKEAVKQKCEYTKKPYTHFLWLDADHRFDPDMACCLARHYAKKHVDAVSALYYGRGDQPLPVVYYKNEKGDKFNHYPIISIPPILCEVDAIGFGACMTKREMFIKTPKPWFTLDWRAGEDIAFCVKAKEHGFRIFVDGAYKMGHIGTAPVICEKDYLEHMEKNKEAYKDKIKVNFGGE